MSETILFVGTNKGAFILQSDTQRQTWEFKGQSLHGWDVSDLQLDQRTSTPTLWAAVNHEIYGQTVQRSKDMGKTWEQIEHGPRFPEEHPSTLNAVWSVVPGRVSEPETLYAGVADAGLFVSRDYGNTWSEVEGLCQHPSREEWTPGAGGMCCHTILVHPTDSQRMWVGISAVGVFRTDDGGTTWDSKNTGLPIDFTGEKHKDIGSCVHRMVLDPNNSDRIFQQNHLGVFVSIDAGDTWKAIESGLPNERCFGFPMVIDPNNSDSVFVIPEQSDEYHYAEGGRLAVYKTTDAGASWTPKTKGLPDNSYVGVLRQAMATDSYNPVGLYFGTTSGQLFTSNDAGESWAQLPGIYPRVCSVSCQVLEN